MRNLTRSAAGFARHRDGGVTVEFAIMVIPFLMLIFGIIELGLILVVDLNLTNATLILARQIRVGSMIAAGGSVATSSGSVINLSDFKQAICNNIKLVPNATCLSNLQIDMRTLSTFTGNTVPNPVSGRSFSSSALCFYSGASGNIVELRAFFLWPLFSPVLLSSFAQVTSLTTSAGTNTGAFFMLISSEVFKNEPNAASQNTGSGC